MVGYNRMNNNQPMYGWLKIVANPTKTIAKRFWPEIKAKGKPDFTPLTIHLEQVAMVAEKSCHWNWI